jgi:N-acetylglucosaminyl-diphospho-decaprenol L-rhamnosyltransferase
MAIVEHGPEPLGDDVVQPLRAAGWDVRVIHDPSNPGWATGGNRLAASSTAPWLLFLNPDAVIVSWPQSDEATVSSPGVFGPERYIARRAASHRGVTYRVRDEIARSWLRRASPAPAGRGYVSGAALLVDAATFRAAGGFDEGYFLFYEDIDFCLAANTAGAPTGLLGGWVVEHAGGHSTSRFAGDRLLWSYQSACRFHGKQGESLSVYRLYVIVDSLGRAALGAVRRRGTVAAYLALARRAAGDLVGRS